MNVFFLPAAAAEHLQHVEYYEAKQPGFGARYLAEVTVALEHLRKSPERFAIARPPHLRRLVLRRFPFTLLFRLLDEHVQVVAVAPHRRAPDYWNNRI